MKGVEKMNKLVQVDLLCLAKATERDPDGKLSPHFIATGKQDSGHHSYNVLVSLVLAALAAPPTAH